MPWVEDDEHNERLYEALRELGDERGALGRLAGAVCRDASAKQTDNERRGEAREAKDKLIDASTLTRWHKGGLQRVIGAQPHKKRIVYEFLERSTEFQTSISKTGENYPPGLLAYAAANSPQLAKAFEDDLSMLDGIYRVYRPAWTVPALSRERVLISRMKIGTRGGLTTFQEDQVYTDPEAGDLLVSESDTGIVFRAGSNIALFGFGTRGGRVKVFAVSSLYPYLSEEEPIDRMTGTTLAISGDGPHESARFIARRAHESYESLEMGILGKDDPPPPRDVLIHLGIKF